jgi:hypothetical protein
MIVKVLLVAGEIHLFTVMITCVKPNHHTTALELGIMEFGVVLLQVATKAAVTLYVIFVVVSLKRVERFND